MDVLDRVHQARRTAGLTIEVLAARSGVTVRTIYRLGDLKVGPSLDTVTRLARVLGVEPGWLAWGEPKEGQR